MQQRGEDTRARILTAAGELFACHGYDAASVAEICTSAGVSKGAFYHHFISKQALFLALLEDWLNGVEKELHLFQPVGDIPTALVEMAGRSGSLFQAAGGQLRLLLEFWTQASRQPAVWSAAIAPFRRYEQIFAGMISKGIKEGSFSQETDPELAAKVVVGLAMGLFMQALFNSGGAAWQDAAQKGMAMLTEGMKGRE